VQERAEGRQAGRKEGRGRVRGRKGGREEESQRETENGVQKRRQEAKTSRKIWGQGFSTECKFYLCMKYFKAVLLGKRKRCHSSNITLLTAGKVELFRHLCMFPT